jgi:hypothetical protein
MNFFNGWEWNLITGVASLLSFLGVNTNFTDKFFDHLTSKELAGYILFITAITFFARAFFMKEKSEAVNDAETVLRDIGLSWADHECALWSFEGVHYQAAQTNYTWEEWLKDINKGERTDNSLDFFNYGDKHYFLNLVTNKKIKIPTGVETKTRTVGKDIKKGMVLMLREYGETAL